MLVPNRTDIKIAGLTVQATQIRNGQKYIFFYYLEWCVRKFVNSMLVNQVMYV